MWFCSQIKRKSAQTGRRVLSGMCDIAAGMLPTKLLVAGNDGLVGGCGCAVSLQRWDPQSDQRDPENQRDRERAERPLGCRSPKSEIVYAVCDERGDAGSRCIKC